MQPLLGQILPRRQAVGRLEDPAEVRLAEPQLFRNFRHGDFLNVVGIQIGPGKGGIFPGRPGRAALGGEKMQIQHGQKQLRRLHAGGDPAGALPDGFADGVQRRTVGKGKNPGVRVGGIVGRHRVGGRSGEDHPQKRPRLGRIGMIFLGVAGVNQKPLPGADAVAVKIAGAEQAVVNDGLVASDGAEMGDGRIAGKADFADQHAEQLPGGKNAVAHDTPLLQVRF